MSGHSKWSKVKHQKAVTDVVKGNAFTKASRAIAIAVREGGGITDPDKNYRLRHAHDKAREVNMPKDTIERAIERAGVAGEASIESIMYEGYGPKGVAILIEAATDNRNRTVSEVKHLLERSGGSLAAPGSVSFLFERSGVITVPKKDAMYDQIFEIALECGAVDIVEAGGYVEVYTGVSELEKVKTKLKEKGLEVDNSMLIMRSKTPISVENDIIEKNEELVNVLEALDDVQKVYTNLV